MTEPTPRPWRFRQGNEDTAWFIRGAEGSREEVHVIVSPAADAEFIVRACNAFDDMKAALEDAQACIVAFRTGEWNDVRWLDQAAKSIHDALKKARES